MKINTWLILLWPSLMPRFSEACFQCISVLFDWVFHYGSSDKLFSLSTGPLLLSCPCSTPVSDTPKHFQWDSCLESCQASAKEEFVYLPRIFWWIWQCDMVLRLAWIFSDHYQTIHPSGGLIEFPELFDIGPGASYSQRHKDDQDPLSLLQTKSSQ